jgi:hypothetical protein
VTVVGGDEISASTSETSIVTLTIPTNKQMTLDDVLANSNVMTHTIIATPVAVYPGAESHKFDFRWIDGVGHVLSKLFFAHQNDLYWGNSTSGYSKILVDGGEVDGVFTNWLGTTPPLYSESDPNLANWLATAAVVHVESDPIWTNDKSAVTASCALANTALQPADGWTVTITNVINNVTQIWMFVDGLLQDPTPPEAEPTVYVDASWCGACVDNSVNYENGTALDGDSSSNVGCYVQLLWVGANGTPDLAYNTSDGTSADDEVITNSWVGAGDAGGGDGWFTAGTVSVVSNRSYFTRIWSSPASDFDAGLVPTASTNKYANSATKLINAEGMLLDAAELANLNTTNTVNTP